MSKAKAEITLYHIIDISKVTRYYKLQSSTANKPSKPTTNPPSGWTTTEPSYTEGSTNSLYTVDLTVFSNNTWSYSEVSLSTSYEAAKSAYNKAHALGTRVTSAEANIAANKQAIELKASKTEVTTAINNISIGGRNLLLNTDFDGESKRHERLEGASTEGGFHFVPMEQIQTGTEYTLSANIRGNANVLLYEINEGGNKSHFWIGRDSLSQTDYKRFSKTFIVDEGKVLQDVYICTQWGEENTLVGDWFEIEPKSLKLEKGNKATDWTPALEDMATHEDITNLEASFTVEAEGIKSEVSSIKDGVNENEENIARANSLIEQLDSRILTLVQDENGTTRLVQTSTGWEYDFSALVGAVQNHSDRLNDYDDKIKLGSYINEKGETEPSIEFSENSTDFKVIITNRRVLFQEGGNTPTYIYDNTLVTENIEVKQELRQGGWVEEIRNNCKCLVWKGVTK